MLMSALNLVIKCHFNVQGNTLYMNVECNNVKSYTKKVKFYMWNAFT